MSSELLSSAQAARKLGIAVSTLYDWLAQSNAGEFMIRGRPFTIGYLQGGRKGQGRIQIAADEIQRMQDAMRVQPAPKPMRRPPTTTQHFPGITVPLGRPG